VSDGVFKPAVTRIPSCVFSSLGISSGDLGSAVALPPLAVFSVRCCVYPAPTTLSVSISLQPSPLSPEALPVQASWPSSRLPFPRGPSVPSGPRTARPDVSPSEVSDFCLEPCSRRRGPAASREVGYPSECCLCVCTWAVGLPRSLRSMSRRFRRTVMVFHPHRPPAFCKTGFILS
jgi:hypothetical protein